MVGDDRVEEVIVKAMETVPPVGGRTGPCIDRDTAQFEVNSIRSWWERLGNQRYPDASRLTIMADCGGSNSNRSRLGRQSCRSFHIRPYSRSRSATSCRHLKMEQIERRLFLIHTMNWRGKLTFHPEWNGGCLCLLAFSVVLVSSANQFVHRHG